MGSRPDGPGGSQVRNHHDRFGKTNSKASGARSYNPETQDSNYKGLAKKAAQGNGKFRGEKEKRLFNNVKPKEKVQPVSPLQENGRFKIGMIVIDPKNGPGEIFWIEKDYIQVNWIGRKGDAKFGANNKQLEIVEEGSAMWKVLKR